MFDFRLKVFQTVAHRLNFTKAARELFITQPAVTKHIKELEAYFGLKLFDRNGSRIRLTDAGRRLLGHADQVSKLYRTMEMDMAELKNEHSGELYIGASTTAAQYILPPIMAGFHQRFPNVSISLKSGNTEEIEQCLLSGEIDVGFIEGQSRKSGISYTTFLKDEIVLVCSANSPLARDSVELLEIKDIPLVQREQGSGTLEVVNHALKDHGIDPGEIKVSMELNSTESIKGYVLNSHCMAFLSIHSILKELAGNELLVVDVQDLDIERYFYRIQLQGEPNTLSKLFINFAHTYNLK